MSRRIEAAPETAGPAKAPAEQAQDLAYAAMSAEGRLARHLARRALAIFPDCADAWDVLAGYTRDLTRATDLYRQAVTAGQRTLGPDVLATKAGEFSWHELATTIAPSAAFGFYAALFDWDLIAEHDMGPMGIYVVFGRNGRQLGGMFDKGAQGKPGDAYWLGYVSVTDLEGAIERAKSARGSVLMGPMDVPGGDRVAQLMDPYGAFFALQKPAGAVAETGKSAPRAPAKKAAAKKSAARKPAKKAPAKRAKPATRKKTKKAAAKKTAARKPAKAKPKKKRGR